jgi:carboxymethylenebutenolidase
MKLSSQGLKVKQGEWDFRLHRGSTRVGIVLVHEIYGLDDYIESVASELSHNGIWAAGVDLFKGELATSLEEGFKLRQSLQEKDVLDALRAGHQLLTDHVGKDAKVGSMGFCMGGSFALLGACNLPLSFCVDYYGMIEDAGQLKGVSGPIQLILGSEDERVTPWAYQQFLPAAMKHKIRADIQLYPRARHAFHRPAWEGHNAEAAADAWFRTLQFLSQFK